jgi:type II secretory pathway pseudopilin PulG
VRVSRRQAAFTLIEILGVLLLLGIVIAAAVNFYIDLSNAAEAATAKTRDGRKAAAVLDRLARDLEATYLLIKPDDKDPLDHPWIFLAEERHSSRGADRLKFVTRNPLPRNSQANVTDLAVVGYQLRPADDESYDLLRWTSPGLPEGLDRSFPGAEDEGVFVMAEGLASFSTRFLREDGQWTGEWDSSTVVESSELPLVAEIQLALATTPEEGFEAEESEVYTRRISLPVRPIDLQVLIAGPGGLAGQGEDEDEEEASGSDGEGESGPGDGLADSGDDGEAEQLRLRSCMSAYRDDLVAQIGQAAFDRYYNAEPGSTDFGYAQSIMNSQDVECP